MSALRPFWLIFSLLVAVAVHLAYVLFVPPSQLQDRMSALIEAEGANRLVIARDQNAASSFTEYPGELTYAVCVFNLADGPLLIKARVPDQYWSIEVYGRRGNTIYTLNDAQAPRRQISLVLHDEPPDPQAIVGAANASNPGLKAITILTGSTSGVAMLRSAGAGTLERQRALDAFTASSCESVRG